MSREEFKERFGEYPEDMLGGDWENIVEYYLDNEMSFGDNQLQNEELEGLI